MEEMLPKTASRPTDKPSASPRALRLKPPVGSEADRQSARDKIVDAAELIFARQGVHGTALREIAETSGVAINLISYHFKTKDDLLRAVLRSHAAHVTAIRRETLTALELRYSPHIPPVGEILAAFVGPIFSMKARDPALWSNFVGLLSKERGSVAWSDTIGATVSVMLKHYALLLQRALPSAKRGDLVYVLSLSFLSFTLTSPPEAHAIIGDELFNDWEDANLEQRLIRSLTAAVLAFA